MELDGTIVGKFGRPGKQLGAFSTVHEIDCRGLRTNFIVWKLPPGESRSCSASFQIKEVPP